MRSFSHWEARGLVVFHWVVQRDAQTGVLITFVSFEDYADAERLTAEVEVIVDPVGHTNMMAMESLPIAEFPKTQNKRCVFS